MRKRWSPNRFYRGEEYAQMDHIMVTENSVRMKHFLPNKGKLQGILEFSLLQLKLWLFFKYDSSFLQNYEF